jgi:thiamine-phosphate pyrophosphorylase
MGSAFPSFYAIVDPAQARGRELGEIVRALLAAGVRLIQYRDKAASARELYARCRPPAEAVRAEGGIFIVNDRADVARAVGAGGVHVGQEDLPVEMARRIVGPESWVGTSTHDLAQLAAADASTADYVAFGPIFSTRSKERPDAVVGLEGLRRARQATRKPLVAIGGITPANARAVRDAGADSVAVIQGLLGASDLGERVGEFLRALEN